MDHTRRNGHLDHVRWARAASLFAIALLVSPSLASPSLQAQDAVSSWRIEATAEGLTPCVRSPALPAVASVVAPGSGPARPDGVRRALLHEGRELQRASGAGLERPLEAPPQGQRLLGQTRRPRGGLDLILDAWRDDGRIRVGPRSQMYPCYTAEAARVLCRHGLAGDERVRATFDYFLDAAHDGGGWRCSFTKFGKGPETKCANPGATLYVLDEHRHRLLGKLDFCARGEVSEVATGRWREIEEMVRA